MKPNHTDSIPIPSSFSSLRAWQAFAPEPGCAQAHAKHTKRIPEWRGADRGVVRGLVRGLLVRACDPLRSRAHCEHWEEPRGAPLEDEDALPWRYGEIR